MCVFIRLSPSITNLHPAELLTGTNEDWVMMPPEPRLSVNSSGGVTKPTRGSQGQGGRGSEQRESAALPSGPRSGKDVLNTERDLKPTSRERAARPSGGRD